MTPIEKNQLNDWIQNHIFGGVKYGLKKRGYWYRPDAHGYTDRQSEAWALSLDEAKKHEYKRGGHDERVSVVQIDTPDYTTNSSAAMEALMAYYKIEPNDCLPALGNFLIRKEFNERTLTPEKVCRFIKYHFEKYHKSTNQSKP